MKSNNKLIICLIIGAIVMATTPSIAALQTIKISKTGPHHAVQSCNISFGRHTANGPTRRLFVIVETRYFGGKRDVELEVSSGWGGRLNPGHVGKIIHDLELDEVKSLVIKIAEEGRAGGSVITRIEYLVAWVTSKLVIFNNDYVTMSPRTAAAGEHKIQLVVRPFTLLPPVELD